jgi:hypothetical protein
MTDLDLAAIRAELTRLMEDRCECPDLADAHIHQSPRLPPTRWPLNRESVTFAAKYLPDLIDLVERQERVIATVMQHGARPSVIGDGSDQMWRCYCGHESALIDGLSAHLTIAYAALRALVEGA